jgi:hypothetical protein
MGCVLPSLEKKKFSKKKSLLSQLSHARLARKQPRERPRGSRARDEHGIDLRQIKGAQGFNHGARIREAGNKQTQY